MALRAKRIDLRFSVPFVVLPSYSVLKTLLADGWPMSNAMPSLSGICRFIAILTSLTLRHMRRGHATRYPAACAPRASGDRPDRAAQRRCGGYRGLSAAMRVVLR